GRMKKRSLLFSVVAVSMLTLLTVSAVPGTHTSAAPGTRIYGPFPSTSQDGGTCANNPWANDAFNRVFRVSTTPNVDGTYNVEEQFKNGEFVTIAGPSPGSCDTNPGGTVLGGITGHFEGTFSIIVTNGFFNPSADCSTGCGTATDFVHTVFGNGATFDITSFLFKYHANDQSLTQRLWQNASADRGGNKGDISTN